MQINNIKVNGFGSLKDKDIELQNGINIIKGKNESGKSTLLKFIPAMFYGLAKTKNGKDISDLEKYRPWNIDEFSGKIYYTLDNNEKIEVYRDFNKKACKIYNQNGEEITENYSIDKSKQNSFFIEQTGISENILMRTAIAEQTETKLDKESQNVIIQKISNVLSTGADNISYKKALTKLKDKQTEEVGTDRTVGRPINIVNNELKKYKEKETEIKVNIQKQDNYELQKSNLNNQKKEIENNLEFLNELKTIKEKIYLEKEKININNNLLEEYDKKMLELKDKESYIEKNNIIKKDNKFLIIFLILLALSIGLGLFSKNLIVFIPIFITSLIFLLLQLKSNSKNKKQEEEKQKDILNIKKEREIIEKSYKEKQKEILKQENALEVKIGEENSNLKNKYDKIDSYTINEMFKFNLEKINLEIRHQEEKINNLKVEISRMEIMYKNILESKENLLEIEEKLQELKSQEEELNTLNNSIELAKVVLEEAYQKMKENITPEFVNNLLKMIKNVSNLKYKNVKFNDIEGLMVELESGEYVKADKLSIGTIDQMYLSLRLASLNEIVKEKMPIILDEAFAYYDDERLKNILEFLNENYKDTQIILFTCADREINILDIEKIKYNLVTI